MRDTMVSEAAVFEPEEAKVLAAAYRLTLDRLGAGAREEGGQGHGEIAKLIHNLGRSRIRLKKPLQTGKHAAEVAAQAIEHLSYLEGAPDAVVAAVREGGPAPQGAERIVGVFPNEFRQPPVNRL